MSVTVSQSIKVALKGQEFELTLAEAKELRDALNQVVPSPPKTDILKDYEDQIARGRHRLRDIPYQAPYLGHPSSAPGRVFLTGPYS